MKYINAFYYSSLSFSLRKWLKINKSQNKNKAKKKSPNKGSSKFSNSGTDFPLLLNLFYKNKSEIMKIGMTFYGSKP